jgi:hypothetical protein
MTVCYICKRCEYKSSLKADMRRHLDRKKKCSLNIIENGDMTFKQIYLESLQPIYEYNNDLPTNNSINNSNNSINNSNNEIDSENILNITEINDISEESSNTSKKLVTCHDCNKCFVSVKNLNFHKKNYCKNDKQNSTDEQNTHLNTKNNITYNDNSINNSVTNNISVDNLTINNTNNTIININPILNINLLDFKEEWKTDHMSDLVKKVVFACQNKFSSFLIEILKNNDNNNVVLDKNSINGYIFNKEKMEFEMKDKDYIIQETVEKLKNQLLDLTCDVIKEPFALGNNDIRKCQRDIKTKYKNYKDCNKKKKKEIDNVFVNIYDKNKKESIKHYKTLKNINPNLL